MKKAAFIFCSALVMGTVLSSVTGCGSLRQGGNVPALKKVFRDEFQVGVAFGTPMLEADQEPARQLAARQFNACTPENEMKWSVIHPEPDRYNFEPADAVVAFAEKHGMEITGHTLVWHLQTPDWVFLDDQGGPASREVVVRRLRDHIHTVMGRYKGRVTGWDVVNEALSNLPGGYLRDSPWRRAIGDDYLVLAYQFAREADPEAKLYYNDFNLEKPDKLASMLRLMDELAAQGIHLDAVGNQGHSHIDYPPAKALDNAITTLSGRGLKINISEIDLSLYSFGDKENRYPNGASREILATQAERYAELFKVFGKHHQHIDRVTFWGVHDGLSWLNFLSEFERPDYPLLFDRDCRPKPAFYALIP